MLHFVDPLDPYSSKAKIKLINLENILYYIFLMFEFLFTYF